MFGEIEVRQGDVSPHLSKCVRNGIIQTTRDVLSGKKSARKPEEQAVSREEALQEARWRLKNAEEALEHFLEGQNNSFVGSERTQEALEKEVERWRARVHGLC